MTEAADKSLMHVPIAPNIAWMQSLLTQGQMRCPAYHLDSITVANKLDQNESPWDWPEAAKQEVAQALCKMPWNRYPEPFPDEVHRLIAKHYQVPVDNVLVGPGSNHMCTLLLASFGRAKPGKLVIARPSFPLYESFSTAMDLAYEPWQLNADLEYDRKLLPELPDGSVVIFASPNNPVGNSLPYAELEKLLAEHPTTLFCADEAYYEYGEKPYTPLLEKYGNLLLVRTLSKTLSSAGIRIGVILGHKLYLDQIKKLLLPFTINHFGLCAIRTALRSQTMIEFFQGTIDHTRRERERMFAGLSDLSLAGGYNVKPSSANFFLMRWPEDAERARVYRRLIERGFLVRDVSKGPGLSGCLRVSLGNEAQNTMLLDSLRELFART